jgi:hypothetical protein
VLPYLFVFTWLSVMFWLPLVVLVLSWFGLAPQAQPAALAVCIGLSLLVWLIPFRWLGFDVRLALLYPLILLAVEAVAVNSLLLSLTGKLKWKDRTLARPRWKWL